MARSVLIIEDDDRIRRVVSITLRREGLEVTEAGSGEEGLARLAERPYDIVLLDLVLPGRSGLEVCREIRRVSTTPVIMVTARADSSDVIAGLEAGADDYVTKPFVAEELSARIRALARRTGGSGPRPRIVVGDLEIAPAAGGNQLLATAQVVFTVTEVPGVEAVRITADGSPVEVPTDDGLTAEPVSREDYASVATPVSSPVPSAPSPSPGDPATAPPAAPSTPGRRRLR